VPKKLTIFLKAAMDVGLAARLKAIRADVERAIADYPPGDTRHLIRLEGQLQRLNNPDLDLVARLVGVLCDQDPSRVAVIAPLARDLQARFPVLASLAARS
jgi:hypothetical protein